MVHASVQNARAGQWVIVVHHGYLQGYMICTPSSHVPGRSKAGFQSNEYSGLSGTALRHLHHSELAARVHLCPWPSYINIEAPVPGCV
jgi:hypothetical protein